MVSKQSVVPVAAVDSIRRERESNTVVTNESSMEGLTSPPVLCILLCYNIVLTILVTQAGVDFLCPEGKYVQGYKRGVLICKDISFNATPTDDKFTAGSVVNSELATIAGLSCN